MNNLIKPASLLMYFLAFLLFFIIGMSIAGFTGAAKGQGLASGAIVFFYGVITATTALGISLIVAFKSQIKDIIKINKILGFLLLLAFCFLTYRILTEAKKEIPSEEYPTQITSPAPVEMSLFGFTKTNKAVDLLLNEDQKMGIGFFTPDYLEYPTLYFYGGFHPDKGLIDQLPMDSVVFAKDQNNNMTTTYAPPWLYPEHLKLDYGIISFKVLAVGRDFITVEANKQTRQKTYLDKYKGKFISMAEFILSVNSVGFNEKSSKKVFIKPLNNADEVRLKFDIMQPIMVEEQWMYVKLLDDSLNELGKGWIRWNSDNVFLITYSLLS